MASLEISQMSKLVTQLEAKIKRQEVALDESRAQHAAALNLLAEARLKDAQIDLVNKAGGKK